MSIIAIVLTCIRSARTIGRNDEEERIERGRRCSLWQRRPRHGWSGTRADEEAEKSKKAFRSLEGKEESGEIVKPYSLWPPYRPPSASRRYKRQSGEEPSGGESRSREPMRRRLTVRSAYSRTCARRSLNAKSKPWRSGISRIRDRACVRPRGAPRKRRGVCAVAFEKRVFSLLDYDGNRCGNVITPWSKRRCTAV